MDAIFGATYVLRDMNFYRFALAKTIREGHLTSQLCKLSTVGPYLLNVQIAYSYEVAFLLQYMYSLIHYKKL